MRTIAFLLALLGLSAFVHAQDGNIAELRVNNPTPWVGQATFITLRLRLPVNAQITNPADFGAWREGEWVTVAAQGEPRTQINGDVKQIEQDVNVTFWQPGSFTMPTLQLTYQDAGQMQTVQLPDVTFTVPSVLDPADLNFRPLREPYAVALPDTRLLLFFALGLAALALLLYRLRSRLLNLWLSVRERLSPVPIPYDADQFSHRLQGVLRQNISFKLKYNQIVEYLRRYMAYQMPFAVFPLTGDELIATLKRTNALPTHVIEQCEIVINEGDSVRFSDSQPNETQFSYFVQRTRYVVAQTEKYHKALEQRQET